MNTNDQLQEAINAGQANSTDLVSAITDSNLPAAITPAMLTQFGLTAADVPAIADLARKIDGANPLSVSEFGRDVGQHTSGYTDALLEQVRNSDLDAAGQKLNEVVVAAKSLNLNALSDRRSRLPIVGPFIDRLRMTKEKFAGHFNTTKDQIDSLIAEVEHSQQGLALRVVAMEEMFGAVKNEYRLFGRHIAAGKIRLDELTAQANLLRQGELSPETAQTISDLESLCANLDKRIGDLTALQQSSLQSMPMIRMLQANNNTLVDKFHTIKEITIPSWKRQFVLALSLNEQKNAVQMANSIDDATNDFLRRNADLLKTNSVAAAKANQRLVIDVSTLEHVQNTLISTVEEVIKIQQDGIKQRQAAEVQIGKMRGELETRLARRIEGPRAA